jgi:hypothetical protein
MWICTSNSFLSIVAKGGDPSKLMVRARRDGEIEAVFPRAKVIANAGTDYKFRALIDREEVAQAMAKAICDINYSNFKNTVKDHARHDAYMRLWSVMYEYQSRVSESSIVYRNPNKFATATRHTMKSKYEPLEHFLRSQPAGIHEVTITFSQMREVLGVTLPESAYVHRPWWSNQKESKNRPQAHAWLSAGFEVDALHQARIDGWVRFRRS